MNSRYELPLAFGAANGPVWLPDAEIDLCETYRDAVRMCWMHRRSKGMTQATLAELSGLYASHVSDYLSADPERRNLPAERISAVEAICGNRAITQWEMRQRGLTVMEEVIARKAA